MNAVIRRSLVPMFEDKMEAYSRRFEKKQFGSFEYKISEPRFVDSKIASKFRGKWVVDIELTGTYKIPGWTFVASLEWVPEASTNIVRKVDPNFDIPTKYLTSNNCEHCYSDRNRKSTIVIYNEESHEFKQVGKQCVRDYIGADAEDYLNYLAIFDSIKSWVDSLPSEGRLRDDIGFTLDEVLEQTIEEVKHYGYISSQTICNWYDTHGYDAICALEKTSSQVYKIMNRVTGYDSCELAREPYAVTDETREGVTTIKQFIADLEDNNDYKHNLKTVFKKTYIDNKNLGLVVSAVGYYIREFEIQKTAEEEGKSKLIGDIGDKIEFTSKPNVIRVYEGENGYTFVYKFVHDGNVILWRTSKVLSPEIEYTIRATVKDHSAFRNVAQTVVTRGKVINE